MLTFVILKICAMKRFAQVSQYTINVYLYVYVCMYSCVFVPTTITGSVILREKCCTVGHLRNSLPCGVIHARFAKLPFYRCGPLFKCRNGVPVRKLISLEKLIFFLRLIIWRGTGLLDFINTDLPEIWLISKFLSISACEVAKS